MSISYVVKCIRKLFKIFIFWTKILNLLRISIFSIIVWYDWHLISYVLCDFHTIAENLHDNVSSIRWCTDSLTTMLSYTRRVPLTIPKRTDSPNRQIKPYRISWRKSSMKIEPTGTQSFKAPSGVLEPISRLVSCYKHEHKLSRCKIVPKYSIHMDKVWGLNESVKKGNITFNPWDWDNPLRPSVNLPGALSSSYKYGA